MSHENGKESAKEIMPSKLQESGWYKLKEDPFPLSQGDVLLNFFGYGLSYEDDKTKNFVRPRGFNVNAIVLTQDCDLLKDKTRHVIFSPIIPFEDAVINHILTDKFSEQIKENKKENPNYSLKDISKVDKEEETKNITSRQIEKVTSDLIQGRLIDFYVIEGSDKFPPQVVLLKESYTLPIESVRKYLSVKHEGPIYSLQSPYKEHMAQAYALTFSRIGLPINLSQKPLVDIVKDSIKRLQD